MTTPRWSIARRLFAIDILTMAFVAALGGGTVARSAQIPDWLTVALTCAVIAAVVPLLGWLRTHLDVGPVRVLHDWSFALYVYVIYRMVLLAAGPGHSGRVFDEWLIAADRWLFGVDPTVWLARLAHPIVTEILQLAYAMSCPAAARRGDRAVRRRARMALPPVGVRLRVRVLPGVRRLPHPAGDRPAVHPP